MQKRMMTLQTAPCCSAMPTDEHPLEEWSSYKKQLHHLAQRFLSGKQRACGELEWGLQVSLGWEGAPANWVLFAGRAQTLNAFNIFLLLC